MQTKTNIKKKTTTAVAVTAPVIEIPAPAPAPVAPAAVVSAEVIGQPNLGSKRITPGTPLNEYRVVSNQRKNVLARYYVQGGAVRIDPVSNREMFSVAVEIPHVDLHAAKTQMVALRAAMTKEVAIA